MLSFVLSQLMRITMHGFCSTAKWFYSPIRVSVHTWLCSFCSNRQISRSHFYHHFCYGFHAGFLFGCYGFSEINFLVLVMVFVWYLQWSQACFVTFPVWNVALFFAALLPTSCISHSTVILVFRAILFHSKFCLDLYLACCFLYHSHPCSLYWR